MQCSRVCWFTTVFKNSINKSNKHAYVAVFPALFAGVEPLKLNIDMLTALEIIFLS